MKNQKIIIGIALLLAISSCNRDEATPDAYPGVPAGEIVALAERDAVLTGDPNGLGGRFEAGPVIWWTNDENIILDCSGEELDDFTDGNEYSFGTDGILYARLPGLANTQTQGGSWKWSNSDKEGILYQGVEFKFTELHEGAVTYASRQTSGDQCAITYQRFVK